MIKKIFDKIFWKFILVGIINTVVGTGIMFICYNILHFNYWVSTAMNYIIGSVVSFFLNKHFTFQNHEHNWNIILKFIINIFVCYLIAYGIAKPLVSYLLAEQSIVIQENGAMLAGMCFYVGLNYLGQRFFTFKDS